MEHQITLKFDPEYVPDAAEISSLSGAVVMPGHAVVHRILKAIVDDFLVQARNADTENEKECTEKIRRAQISSQIYQQMVDRINLYVSTYTAVINHVDGQIIPDNTDEDLGMGEVSYPSYGLGDDNNDFFNF